MPLDTALACCSETVPASAMGFRYRHSDLGPNDLVLEAGTGNVSLNANIGAKSSATDNSRLGTFTVQNTTGSIQDKTGSLTIGGADSHRHYPDCYVLALEEGELKVHPFPFLPRPLAYATGALVGMLAGVVPSFGAARKPVVASLHEVF